QVLLFEPPGVRRRRGPVVDVGAREDSQAHRVGESGETAERQQDREAARGRWHLRGEAHRREIPGGDEDRLVQRAQGSQAEMTPRSLPPPCGKGGKHLYRLRTTLTNVRHSAEPGETGG